jgi:hypothetical protein
MEEDVVQLINKAKMMDLIDEDSTIYNLEPLPGLNESELKDLEKNLPCQIPTHIRNLLTECRGIDGLLDIIEFTGQECASGFEFELFPTAIAIAHDGITGLSIFAVIQQIGDPSIFAAMIRLLLCTRVLLFIIFWRR